MLLPVLVVLVPPVSALAAGLGPIPPRLAGTYAANVPNVLSVGLYAGRYKLKFEAGAKVFHYIVPGEGPIGQGVSVSGQRITFLPGGVCLTRGSYIWQVRGRILTFKKVNDACAKRAVQLVRRWTRTA